MTDRRSKLHLVACAVCLIALLAASCQGQADPAKEREQRAAQAKGDIVIGVAWSEKAYGPGLRHGVELAGEEINSGSQVLGRKVSLIFRDDESSVTTGKLIAQQFAENRDMVAVIGHIDSDISIPTSTIYQFAGLLMLSPGSTSPRLTQQGFKLVFRNIPTDQDIGKKLVGYASRQGYKRMVILAAKSVYERELANILEKQARLSGITIVDRQSYTDASAFPQILAQWKALEYDAVFMAADMPQGALFIKQAREANVQTPFLGGDSLDSADLWQVGGEAVEGTVVATPFHSDTLWPGLPDFKSVYQKRYGALPDATAALGYDAMRLLAYAMTQAGSTMPVRVAEQLHKTTGWPGVTGPHTFSPTGDVIDKPVILEKVQGAKFVIEP